MLYFGTLLKALLIVALPVTLAVYAALCVISATERSAERRGK